MSSKNKLTKNHFLDEKEFLDNRKITKFLFNNPLIKSADINDEMFYSVLDTIQQLADSDDPKDIWDSLQLKYEDFDFKHNENFMMIKESSNDGMAYESLYANVRIITKIMLALDCPRAKDFSKKMRAIWKMHLDRKHEDTIETVFELISFRLSKLEDIDNEKLNELYITLFKGMGMKLKKEKSLIMNRKIDKEIYAEMNHFEQYVCNIGCLIFNQLTKDRESTTFEELNENAKEAGVFAGNVKENIEKIIGKSIFTKKRFI